MNGIISDNSIVNLGNLQQYIWLEFRIVNILVIFSKIPSSHHQDTYRVKSREPVGSKNTVCSRGLLYNISQLPIRNKTTRSVFGFTRYLFGGDIHKMMPTS